MLNIAAWVLSIGAALVGVIMLVTTAVLAIYVIVQAILWVLLLAFRT